MASTWEQFNNLVGKGRPWGPKKYLEPWQLSLYTRAHHMWVRCKVPTNTRYSIYGGAGIDINFAHLSDYVSALQKDPHWNDFVAAPNDWEVDKDIKCGHGVDYAPDTIMLVLQSDNLTEMQNRCGCGVAGHNARHCVVNSVEYESCVSAAVALGVKHQTLSEWLRDPSHPECYYI